MKLVTKKGKSSTSTSAAKRGPQVAPQIAKLLAVEAWVNGSVFGRKEIVRGMTLAIVAGANVLMVGPPGTAKTKTVQMQAASLGAEAFDILLTKFTKPAEVFGPLSLPDLERGVVRYNTDGYLPSCMVGIVDEVFKGSSAILNALLRIANERTFRNGNDVERTPVRTLVGMSNEFAEDASLLAAFYDRFALKFMVKPLDRNDFADMIGSVAASSGSTCTVSLTAKDMEAIDALVDACEFGEDVVDALVEIREQLNAKGVAASDRRYAQAIRILKAAAVVAGRDHVTRKDLKVLSDVLWSEPSQRPTIDAIIATLANPYERQLRGIVDEVYEERRVILAAGNYDGADKNRASPDNKRALEEAAKALSRVRSVADRLGLIGDIDDSPEGQAMHQRAVDAIESIETTIKLIAQGKGKLADLAAITDF